jgi:hypothetical protein
LLGIKSGAQLQIGGGLPLPIQLTDGTDAGSAPDWGASLTPTNGILPDPAGGPGASVFPPLLIPRRQGGATVMTSAGALTIPTAVLSRAPVQETLGVRSQHPSLFAVGLNNGYKWPAASAMLSKRGTTMTFVGGTLTFPTAGALTVLKKGGPTVNQMITYKNTAGKAASPFGGVAPFNVTPVLGGGVLPAVPVTLYNSLGTPPPCVACNVIYLAASLKGDAAPGATPLRVITSTGPTVGTAKNIGVVNAGATPRGTISTVLVANAATGPPATNMASSTGFFWTTGHITARAPGAKGTPEYFLLSGSDQRAGGMGAGTIKLVSGALSQRQSSGPNANRGWIQLVLVDPPDTPALSTQGLMTLAGSLVAVALFAMVRRNRRSGASA